MHIAIIGCGNIGAGFAKGLSQEHTLKFYDQNSSRANELAIKTSGRSCQNLSEAIQGADWIIIAVKPQDLEEVAKQINPFLQSHQLLISVLAGISVEILKNHFKIPVIIRMMPNLALIYGEGVIGISEQDQFSLELKRQLETIFAPLGKVFWILETKMDALTALTGSGPAFIFTFIEAMIEAGIVMGFSAKEAQELILQMIKGSLTILEKTGQHPGELRWQVASPAGTTIAGLKKLEEEGIRGKIMNVFLAAYERAQALKTGK